MIRAWLWRALDTAARALLVPDRLFRAIRGGYERRPLAPLDEADLTEDEFDDLAAKGEPVTVVGHAAPNGWSCDHVTITAGGASLLSATAWCGCVMRPHYATR